MKILVIGGSLYFGKVLVEKLLQDPKIELTLLNRGNSKDNYGDNVNRIFCDRNDTEKMKSLTSGLSWDFVFDQVCYDYNQAKNACEIFYGKVGKYIFTSSQSVYDPGSNIAENVFDPNTHEFKDMADPSREYGEAKRQAEVAFEKHADFPVVFARFPIVIGKDDYTKRLLFHVERIRDGKEIFFNNLDATISLISQSMAADALLHMAKSNLVGPVNADMAVPLKVGQIMNLIEAHTGKELIQAKERTEENYSPYSIPSDWFMNSKKLQDSDFVRPNTRIELLKILPQL